jgi:hypothetical protein
MLKGFIDTVRRMQAEAAAAQLMKYLFGTNAEGKGEVGGSGGILSTVFNGIGSIFGGSSSTTAAASSGSGSWLSSIGNFFGGFFADGGNLAPGKFGIVGEEGPELIYGGSSGANIVPMSKSMGSSGNTYNIDARGADVGAVRRLEASLFALAGPGVIEQRVGNATSRGML